MSTIRCIGSFAHKFHHLKFNAALLIMCSNAASKVVYKGAQDFTPVIKDIPSNICLQKMYVVKGKSRLALSFRYIIGAFQNIRQLLITPKCQIIVYNENNVFALRVVNFLNKALRKKIVIFCHGDMELLVADTHNRGHLFRIQTSLVRSFYLNKKVRIASNMHFFVLGENIYNEVKKLLPADKIKHFHSIDHPYIFTDGGNKTKTGTGLHCGTVGVFSVAKGGNAFCELADILNSRNIAGLGLSANGYVFQLEEELKARGVDVPLNTGGLMDEAEFNARIKSLDYILFFYSSDSYLLTASGAIMDSINTETPIIALRNPFFSYLFDKYGEFGYLVDNIEEMADIITGIAGNILKKDFDFKSIQTCLSPERLGEEFKKKLHEIGYM